MKTKLEIDDIELPQYRKLWSHYQEIEALVEFAKIFILQK